MGDEIEITTWSNSPVKFYKITSSILKVDIKVPEQIDAFAVIYLLLPLAHENAYKSVIYLSNHGCFIKNPFIDHGRDEALSRSISAGFLSHKYTKYWIRWSENRVSVGRHNELVPFVSERVYREQKIAYSSAEVGFSVGRNNHQYVQWRFKLPPQRAALQVKPLPSPEGAMKWKSWEGGDSLPEDALIAGHEGEPIYIIRSEHERSLTPGKYVPSKRLGFVSWNMVSNKKNKNLEFLCGYNAVWEVTYDAHIPPGAIEGGYSEDRGERLYIGRAWHEGHLIPGKVQASHKCCYIAYLDKEIRKKSYEILIDPQASDTVIRVDPFRSWD